MCDGHLVRPLRKGEKELVEGGHGARGNENVGSQMQASFPGLLGI